MKKQLILIAVLLLSFYSQAQTTTQGLTRVTKMQGIEIYALCEPLREYDVAFTVETGAKAGSILSGGIVNEGVSDKLSQFVKRTMKEAEKQKKQVDAIIYSGGKLVSAIKFKAESTPENKGVAKVTKIEGYDVYVMNEPFKDYETVLNVGTGLKAKSYVTGGLVNNSVEEDIAQYVRRAVKDAAESKKAIDAVIYTGGKNAIGVKFK